jgi:purine-binding chemotaxis protein CheW
MDFLEIRRRAKERAARAVASGGPTVAAEVPAESIVVRSVRHPPGSVEAQRMELELGSRVAALPHSRDARFVTWRPDGGGFPELDAIHPGIDGSTPDREGAWPPLPLAALDDFFYREDEAPPLVGPTPPEFHAELVAPVALVEYLIFHLAGETYGVEIGRVLEVMRTPPITEVPRAPVDVRGVISVRGEVITLVDPRGRLGLPPAEGPPGSRVVIVDDGDGACGWLVDRLAGVVRLPGGALEPCPQTLGSAGGDLFLGIGRERGRLFLVIDPRAVLRPLRRSPEARPG